ncbi:hypothetical protein Q8A73_002943 [Channa argus]|nr:hypothetical protein Q8A73_002943 [Channa argus]
MGTVGGCEAQATKNTLYGPSVTSPMTTRGSERSRQWQNPSQPQDLSKDSQYSGRVQVFETETGRSTLRITDLRETDSAQYHFKFTTWGFEWRSSLPGTTLTVTALQVQVIRSTVHQFYTEAELKCLSSKSPTGRLTFVWFNNGQKINKMETASYKGQFNPGDHISCALKEHEDCPSPPVYPPKLPSVSVSPSAEIVEGSSVTLTCSSDANPAASYTWYKENEDSPKASGQIFTITDIRPEHSGNYYCEAQNTIGRHNSTLHLCSKLSLSPSMEIDEGSSLTVTCSSDANPAAKYTCLTAATSGFVVFLLSVSVIQGQNNWGVTYTDTHICVLEGSTVDIYCTYTYPSRINGRSTTVQTTSWFTKWKVNAPVDLRTDPDYTGRVEYYCPDKVCTLTIRDVRQRDSAVYKFRFITNQPGGRYTGEPGVTLSVTDLQVQVITSRFSSWADVTCQSSCLPDHLSYIWYKNGQKIQRQSTSSYEDYFSSADSISCAVKGHEKFPSPSVYPPQLPSVSVSPSAEIVEGSSVTLTCSSDANPAANYTWYKQKGPDLKYSHEKPQFVFRSIKSSASGQYYCTAENKLGGRTSEVVSINVKYPPKLPSVSVSPSAEIVEGSSVTLTCSSDANPAANYTWYKENEDSPKASGQKFTITDFRPENSGNYSCEAQNTIGRQNSTLCFIALAGKSLTITNIIRLTLVVLIPLLVMSLWMRKKKTQNFKSELNESVEMIESDSQHDYQIISDATSITAAQRDDTEQHKDLV